MRAIILAGGTGSRLGEITSARTKGMVPVNGKVLIDYLLDFFELDFFNEIIIVGGYYYEDLKKHIEAKNIANTRTVENREYLKGNIFTLLRGLDEFSADSFLITNVDHIYPRVMFEKMKRSFTSITAMCDFDRILYADDMKVKLRNGAGSIKKISKELKDFDCGYIGMTYVDNSMYDIYREAVEITLKNFGEKAVVENVLQVLAEDKKTAPLICDLSRFGWYEVDTKEDLEKAEKGLLEDKNYIR